MNHDLKHWKAVTLIVKAESLDARIRREHRPPLEAERREYALIVRELERRHENKVLPYYRGRLADVYRPSSKYAAGGG